MRIQNSFIPVHGVGEKTERRLWERGIYHWDFFDEADLSNSLNKRISSFITTATEKLDENDAAYFAQVVPNNAIWRLYENFRNSTCFLDIETTGLNRYSNEITVISFYYPSQSNTNTLIQGKNLTRDTVKQELEKADYLVTFNGKTFDIPFIENEFKVSIDKPHLDLRYSCNRIGLRGGLKAIEREIGIYRNLPELSGEDAIELWYDYLRGGSKQALNTLIEYNQTDVHSLLTLVEHVLPQLHDEIFASVITQNHSQQPRP